MAEGSVVKHEDGRVTFDVTDGAATVPVAYKGILPDLFREGQGVVTEGLLGADGVFSADIGARQARREIHAARGRRRAQGAGRLAKATGLRPRRNRQWMGAEFGHFALVLALVLALVQSPIPFVGALRRRPAADGGRAPRGGRRSSCSSASPSRR